MWIDEYETVLGMEVMKQFEAIIVPHMKKLYIYDECEKEPIGIPTIGTMVAECKLIVMNVDEVKQDEEVYKRLPCTDAKLMKQ